MVTYTLAYCKLLDYSDQIDCPVDNGKFVISIGYIRGCLYVYLSDL